MMTRHIVVNTMSFANNQQPDSAVLRIEGELTLYRCSEPKETLLAARASGVARDIDLAGVTDIDTAGAHAARAA